MSIQDEEAQRLAESEENMRAWEAGIERIKADLQSRLPDLFDETGELRAEEAMKLIRQRAGGKRELTGIEFLELIGQRPARRVDAP